jgi:flagellar hook-associated protein 2
MGGTFSAGGLISGIDSNTLISQLMQLERQPITRFNNRITQLETRQTAMRDLRTQLTTLRNRLQDFRLNNLFSQFTSSSSKTDVLTSQISGSNPVTGSFNIEVLELASASTASSSGPLGAAINPNAALDSSGIASEITGGAFSINGVSFTIDPTSDTLQGVLNQINSSGAGVTATYNASLDKVTIANTTAGDTSVINFSTPSDGSNLLQILSVTQGTQSTNGNGSTEVTGTRRLGALDAGTQLDQASFANGALTAGSFSINGISISIDPTEDSLLDIAARISGSDAGVQASYDGTTDTLRFTSNTLGSRTIRFGSVGDTSNFLSVTSLDTAVQTAGKDAQFTVDGGPAQTRNANEVSDVISGVTLNFLSTGTSSVTVTTDADAIVEDVNEFLTEFNNSVGQLRGLTATEGSMAGDTSLRQIDNFLIGNIFNIVNGISGQFSSLLQIGISTGEEFDASSTPTLQLNEETFREALRDDRENVKSIFTNTGNTGVADVLFGYLDGVTSFSGFLNERTKSNGAIDQQIRGLNDQIERYERRLDQKEERLRRQFLNLERLSAGFQNQAAALSRLGSRF